VGPGTGDRYRELLRELTDYVEFLLAEHPVEAGSHTDQEVSENTTASWHPKSSVTKATKS
jgi:hypothetical protein